jgi:ribosome-associated protein
MTVNNPKPSLTEPKFISKDKALLIAASIDDKKGEDIIVLDVSKLSIITDFFVISTGYSSPQIKAIADHIVEVLSKNGVRPAFIEGLQGASWVAIDYGDVIVHIFDEEKRNYYELEKLWFDAPQIPLYFPRHPV